MPTPTLGSIVALDAAPPKPYAPRINAGQQKVVMSVPPPDPVTITRDEWLAALSDATTVPSTDPRAKTLNELVALTGLSHRTLTRRIKQLEAMGKVERTRKAVRMANGGFYPTAAYILLDQQP